MGASLVQRLTLVLPAVAAVLVCSPMFAYPLRLIGQDTWRSHDWLASAKFDAFARMSILRWHSLPHWNPFLQGGMPQLAHPSDGSVSPLFLPSLLLGEALGMKVVVAGCLVAGSVATALLARDRWGLRPPYAAFAGVLFAVAGWVPSRVSVGFYESTLFPLIPLIAWLTLTSERRPGRLFAAVLLLGAGAMQMQLGLVIMVMALLLLIALEAIHDAAPRKLLIRAAVLCVGAAGVAAVKLVPMALALRHEDFRRVPVYPTDYDSWYGSVAQFVHCALNVVPFPGQYDARGFGTLAEFGYLGLGPIAALLLVLSIVLARRAPRRIWVPAVCFALFVWLSFGPNAPVDLFRPLWPLPLFESMRGPIRYTSFVVFWLACPLAAVGLQSLRGGARRVPTWVVGAVAVAACAWPAVQSAGRFATSFTEELQRTPRTDEAFHQEALVGDLRGQSRGGDTTFTHGNLLKYTNLKAGIGTIYDPEDLPAVPVAEGIRRYHVDERRYLPNPGYRGEAWCAAHECDARVVDVRANRVVVEATLRQGDVLVLNQRWNPAWVVSQGDLADAGGLVGARASEAGEVTVEFRYRSPGFVAGACTSLATLCLAVGLLVFRRSARGQPANS
jgi:hypothetical protein